MSFTTTEVFGFTDAVRQFMLEHETQLTAAGLNVAPWIGELASQKEAAVAQNQAQESLKTKLREATTATETALKTTYNTASSRLDAMIGTLGKTSELARQAARLRSAIRRGSNAKPEPAPQPPSGS